MKKIAKAAASIVLCLVAILGAAPIPAYGYFYTSPYPESAETADGMVYLLNWNGATKLVDEQGQVLLEGTSLQFVYDATRYKPQCVVDLWFDVYRPEGSAYPRYTVYSALYGLDGTLLANWQPVRYSGGMGDWVVAQAGEAGWEAEEETESWLQNLYTGEQRYRGEFEYLNTAGAGFISYYKGAETMLLMGQGYADVWGIVDTDANLVAQGPWPEDDGYMFTCNGYLVQCIFSQQGEEYYIQSYTDESSGTRLYDVAAGYRYIYSVDGYTALQTLPTEDSPARLLLEDTAAGEILFDVEAEWEFAFIDWFDGENICLFSYSDGSRLYNLAGQVLFEGERLVRLEYPTGEARYLAQDNRYIYLLNENGRKIKHFMLGRHGDAYGSLFEIAKGRYGWYSYGEKAITFIFDEELTQIARLDGSCYEVDNSSGYISVYSYGETYQNSYYKTYDANGGFIAYGQVVGNCLFAQEGYSYTMRGLQGNLLYSENRFAALGED